MKIRKIIYFLTLFAFLLSMIGMSSALSLTPIKNYTVNTSNQCAKATVTEYVGAKSGQDAYNVTSISVPSNTCVKIQFHDQDTVNPHTFTINTDSANNVTLFNIYVAGGQTVSSIFYAPNANITLTYYCAVPGHYDQGMYGTLKVGSASSPSGGGSKSSPGFEMIPVFMGLFTIAAIATIYKKKNLK